ncbi:hypothetical protein FRX31_034390 [Thalictrum thalictroides]|uniref:Uncharacterized protein n=1 Tax=Thalictrum thalictroides TaxID=46969 RepID=A0A7J6UTT6_THATH|nr:hypothetical protein FRX31_034390 [Thalictrum thalictroides]
MPITAMKQAERIHRLASGFPHLSTIFGVVVEDVAVVLLLRDSMTLIRPSSSKVNALIGGQLGQSSAMVRGISLQVQKEEEDDEALERERVRELER